MRRTIIALAVTAGIALAAPATAEARVLPVPGHVNNTQPTRKPVFKHSTTRTPWTWSPTMRRVIR